MIGLQKNRADLYVRVSTDEQADKGYSQRSQEEMLRRYCDNHEIEIMDVIYEDHSAKSFNRPEWKKLLTGLKKNRRGKAFILFTKWDRFSRNAGDAYQMINILRRLGVEPQAIEQPLDLTIPENKMMLAFYLAAPEVENDRRALNVIYGMRRAKKEGRHMGLAPIGYKNMTDAAGKKYIATNEQDAVLIRWAFEELSKGVFNTEQIWKKVRGKGLRCSKNAFWQLIRNPLYCGKIFIPQFKDEGCYFVQGQHEAIISEQLFQIVQDKIDGRARTYRPKMQTMKDFPLKGFLLCPICLKLLTASKSKGRNKYYSYYHCYNGCSFRTGAGQINKNLICELRRYVPNKDIIKIFNMVIMEIYEETTQDLRRQVKQTAQAIQNYLDRINHIRNLLADKQIAPFDYNEIKHQYQTELVQLQHKLEIIKSQMPDIGSLLKIGIEELLKLDYIVKAGYYEQARSLLKFLYPNNIVVDSRSFLSGKPNLIIRYLYHYQYFRLVHYN